MDNKYYIIKLGEKISSENASAIEEYLQSEIDNHPGLLPIMDASDLKYISSSGLRVILKIQKQFEEKIKIKNVSLEIYDIFDMTGFSSLLDVEKRMRELSVEGCKIIGKGYYGTVYRLDGDTIVKVYHGLSDSISLIKNEQKMARIAFISGIPTAISYDIVKVGNDYGSVFELLNAKSLNDVLIENIDNPDIVINKYVDFIKSVHNTTLKEGSLPKAKDNYLHYLSNIKHLLPSRVYNKLHNLISNTPDSDHLNHGDIHMKNIMVVDGELTLIDMETLSTGLDIFDNCCVYLSYKQYPEDDPNNAQSFFGISNELSNHIFETFIKNYYNYQTPEEYQKIINVIYTLASVHFLYLIESSSEKDDKLSQIRKKKTISRLKKIVSKVDTLEI